MDQSRPQVMRAVAGGVSAGFLLRVSQAQVHRKEDAAAGRISGHAERHLQLCVCSLFEPPQACKVVEGDVSRDGWCKALALAP